MADETPQEPTRTVFKYAQIDTVTGFCYGVSFLSGEVIADNMIELTETDEVKPGDSYIDGVWTPAPPIVPVDPGPTLQEQIAELNDQNVQLWEILIEKGVV